MLNRLTEIKTDWQKTPSKPSSYHLNIDRVYHIIRQKEDQNFVFYKATYYSIIICLVLLILFFVFVAPVEHFLSRAGVALMIVSSIARIYLTYNSIEKAKKIILIDQSIDTTKLTIEFYGDRMDIHNKKSPLLFVALTLGFIGILPEFALYLETYAILIIIALYIAFVVIFSVIFRENTHKEYERLSRIISLKEDLHKNAIEKNKSIPKF